MFTEDHKHGYKCNLYAEGFPKLLVFHGSIFYRREIRYRELNLLTQGYTPVIHSSKPIAAGCNRIRGLVSLLILKSQ